VFCVWASCGEGRTGLRPRSPAKGERSESSLEVLRALGKRGLQTPVPRTTAGAPGRTKARDARWPHALRIRCWVHTRQNRQPQVPPQAGPECKAVVADRRAAPTVPEADRRRQLSVTRSPRDFPEAGRGLVDEAAAALNPLYVPQRPQPYGRTATLAERAVAEERRRTKVLPHLWDEGRVVNLVLAVLRRVRERWGKKGFREFAQHQLRRWRQRRQLDDHEVRTPIPPTEPQSRRSAASAA
jgi:putative transposase